MTDESTRHAMRRRPLLSPVFIVGAVAVVVLLIVAWVGAGYFQDPGMVIVTRHVEKADEPADNPGPSELGAFRADRLADMFEETGVDSVFASHLLRSFSTASPLARRISVPVHIYEAPDVAGLVARIDSEHRHDTVFVVGHSNTVPDIVEALSGQEVAPIDESRYGDLFVVIRPKWGRAQVFQYYMPAPVLPSDAR
jgi:phosphohistidine phosphatase SixA